LLSHLLWYLHHGDWALGEPRPPPRNYRAPSWSWASTNSRVVSPYHFADCCLLRTELVEVLEAETTGLDTFGQLQSGHIKLRGFLKLVSFFEDTRSSTLKLVLNIDGDSKHWGVHIDNPHDSELRSGKLESFVLPVLSHSKAYFPSGHAEVQGLVLAQMNSKVPEDSSTEFGRIGYFSFNEWGCSRYDWKRRLCVAEYEQIITLV
jgi:hypothetical protein